MTDSATPQSADFRAFAAALAGQYDLECEIGRGGMGVVYRARDLKLDRLVAIKTLPPHLAADPAIRERFLREARTAGSLSHPDIVPVHRADELDGRVFFVMGLVNGTSMADRIRDQGRLDPIEVLHILCDVASALEYAHGHHVIHRDIKAENILIDDATGRAVVTDFGIARLAEAAPLTATGQILGTVYYLSPEQVAGESVDARSDIYALGVVGYFALSGRFPVNAELASAVLIAHVTKTPPPLREVAPDTPEVLTDIIDRCLAKNPGDRFQSCAELHEALSSVEKLVAAEVHERASASEPTLQPLSAQPLLSQTEAHDILARAANLQAATGVHSTPIPIVGSRDGHRPGTSTSGHRLGNVREAAIEAGISPKYVDRALLEHGLTPRGNPAEVPLAIVDRSKGKSRLAGERLHFEYEISVPGEMPEGDYDLLVDIIRRNMQDPGQLSAVGRAFTWQSHAPKRHVSVTVLPRGGKTTIRVSEHMRGLVGALFGGIMGGVGGGTAGVWIGIGSSLHSLPLGFGLWGAAIVATYGAARTIFSRASRRRQTTLRTLSEELALQARESIGQVRQIAK